MRFIDETRVRVASGSGGDGCASFRRERYVPQGGPDGGDGGRGGDVVVRATTRRSTLLELRGHAIWKARNGSAGGTKRCTGKSADAVVLEVPVGTRVFDDETDDVLADLTEDEAEWVAAEGGRGGLGNWHFKSSTNRSPRRTTSGKAGVERLLRFELMLMADVGLLGFPNAGKSTLVARMSAARPRVADYPFTTLTPSLGVVDMGTDGTYVIADIPGIIAGAADGAGLGHQFLRHLGRTRLLLHLVSASEHDEAAVGLDPLERYLAVRRELDAYDSEADSIGLASRPELVVVTKTDAVTPERLAEVAEMLRSTHEGRTVLTVSTVTGDDLDNLRHTVWRAVQALKGSAS